MRAVFTSILLLLSGPVLANSNDSNLEKSGDVLHLLIPAVTLGATLFVEDDYEGSWQLLKTGLVSRLAVEGLKYAVHKERPDGSGNDSFPSGHAADTFAAATFVQQRYGWEWAIPAYIGAAYVGYTRVASDQHHIEDVLAGAAIGVLSGLYFTDPYKGITITPIAGNGGYGLHVSGKF
ncbi:phosphatase PAP2 family protein [Shewanella violacea]|uniref:undecaprenyl-diphosphate phosphatase n=1 Tax=Shewanella violacea (strain JCM 10179 / CIP 106290 / LMG 19151 / DSS12) TaxID=637905 RepID=D4ZBM8_SHEVD|nr:phosphatase PAP2 family protein [Shewanella violacea]BAJ03423.1 PAP2 family protein [Shewanella violacea DSS12]